MHEDIGNRVRIDKCAAPVQRADRQKISIEPDVIECFEPRRELEGHVARAVRRECQADLKVRLYDVPMKADLKGPRLRRAYESGPNGPPLRSTASYDRRERVVKQMPTSPSIAAAGRL